MDAKTHEIFLRLVINGTIIEGESTAGGSGNNQIECISFRYGVTVSTDAANGQRTARRQHQPIVIQKRIDKSTPLIIKALVQNERVDEAEFRFFRPGSPRTGITEHFYTVRIRNGSITSINQVSETSAPPMEEVVISFASIEWTYEIGGVTYQDDFRRQVDQLSDAQHQIETLSQRVRQSDAIKETVRREIATLRNIADDPKTEYPIALTYHRAEKSEAGYAIIEKTDTFATQKQLLDLINELEALLNTISNASKSDLETMQVQMDKASQLFETISTMQKQIHDTAQRVIQNLR